MLELFKKERAPEHFNKRASLPQSKAEEIVEALCLKNGQSVADLGSGGGYFSLKFAQKVSPGGQVYALDTNKRYLDHVMGEAKVGNISNISPVQISGDIFFLPDNVKIDLLFTRNVYHHLKERVKYFLSLKPFLNKGARIVILDYKKTLGLSFHALFRHYTPESTIIDELNQAGYDLFIKHDLLPEQCFLEFISRG